MKIGDKVTIINIVENEYKFQEWLKGKITDITSEYLVHKWYQVEWPWFQTWHNYFKEENIKKARRRA